MAACQGDDSIGLESPFTPPPPRGDSLLDQEELINSFRQVLRAELNSFGLKYLVSSKRQQKTVRVGPLPTGTSSLVEHQLAPHAWVSRSVRSYAAAAELAELGGMVDAVSGLSNISSPEKLLPDIIPKGTGPLARRQKRLESSSSDGPVNTGNPSSSGLLNLLPMSSFLSEPHARVPKRSGKALFPPLPGEGTRQAWAERRIDKAPSYAMSLGSDESNAYVSEVSASPAAVAPVTRDLSAKSAHNVVRSQSSNPQPTISQVSNCNHSASSELAQAVSVDKVAELARSKEVEAASDAVREEPSSKSSNSSDDQLSPAETTKPYLFQRMSTIYSAVSTAFRRSGSGRLRLCTAFRVLAYRLARNFYFENLTVLFIIANAITIGIQTDFCARELTNEGPRGLRVVNVAIAAFFGVEVCIRLFAYRLMFFTMSSWRWNLLDLFVVGLQIFEELMNLMTLEDSNMPIALSLLRMVRILRLVRIIRIVRLLRYMSELRTIVVSIIGSLKPLCSTIVLLALVVYIVGIYFTQLTVDYRIDHAGSKNAAELEEYFGSVGITVISLFQTVTGGLEWRNMLTPLMEHISPAMSIIFALYIVFTSLALMNIVTGVFVETALQKGREDKDVYMINHLKDLFGALDENNSGTISWVELVDHLDDPKLLAFFKDIDIDISEAKGLFHLLDRDGSGWIDADEFLSGCLRLRGPAKALDLQLVMLELADQRRSVQKLLDVLEGHQE